VALILIAEDNAVTLEMMGTRLQHAGHRVLRAANGREALELLEAERPDLILLDMMMPEVDGAEFLARVKGDAVLGSIPIVVVSARSHEDDVLAALAAGADDYVTKPISLRELIARVDRVLAQGPEPLRVAVQGDEGPVRVGELVAADPRSAQVRFYRDGAPRFAIGDRAKLTLSSPSLPEAVELRGKVTSRSEAEPHRSYGFDIECRSDEERERVRAFLNLVGRRGDFRAPIDPENPIPVQLIVQLEGEARELQGSLLDVSARGARVLLKHDAERMLVRIERFELRFTLPGSDATTTLSGEIRHRAVARDGVAYGLRYDPDASPDFLEQQEQISSFVLARMS